MTVRYKHALLSASLVFVTACQATGDPSAAAANMPPAFRAAYQDSLWAELDARNCSKKRNDPEIARQSERFARLKQMVADKGGKPDIARIEEEWSKALTLIERDCPQSADYALDFRKALDRLEAQISKFRVGD